MDDRMEYLTELDKAGLGDVPQPKIPLDWRERLPQYPSVREFIQAIEREWRMSLRHEAYESKTLIQRDRERGRDLASTVMLNAQLRRRNGEHRTQAERVAERCAAMKARNKRTAA